MTNVALYARVSTDEQAERGNALNQTGFFEKWAELHGHAETGVYADEGVSGRVPFRDRPNGARLLKDIESGKVSRVAVYRVDRIGRDPKVILDAVDAVTKAGAVLVSMTEPFDTETPAGKMMLTMLAGIAGFERDSIVERSGEGMRRRAARGAWQGGVTPYGYRAEGRGADARLAINEDAGTAAVSEADAARAAFRAVGEEGRTCVWVAHYLNALDIPPPHAGRKTVKSPSGGWYSSTVSRMLRYTLYKGEGVWGKKGKGLEIPYDCPPLVSRDLWDKVQAALADNRRFAPKTTIHEYLLSGKIHCSHCGCLYCGKADARTVPPILYYACTRTEKARAGRRGKCPGKMIRAEELAAAVWEDVSTFLRDPGETLARIAEARDARAEAALSTDAELAALGAACERLERERARVIGLYRRGGITDEELDAELLVIGGESAAARGRMAEAERGSAAGAAARDALGGAGEMLRELRRQCDSGFTPADKRRLIGLLVEEATVETTGEGFRKDAVVRVRYRFARPPTSPVVTVIRTGLHTNHSNDGESTPGGLTLDSAFRFGFRQSVPDRV